MLSGDTRWDVRFRIRKPPVVGSNPTAGCILSVGVHNKLLALRGETFIAPIIKRGGNKDQKAERKD